MNNRKIAAAILLFSTISLLPACGSKPKNDFGAIAYSVKARKYGVGGGVNKEEAKKNAVKFCETPDCEVVYEYTEDWGAFAIAKGDQYGGGAGKTKADAQNNALEACKKAGGEDCQVVVADNADEK